MANDFTGQGRVGRGITDHVCVDVDGTLLLWPAKAGSARPEEVAAAYAYLAGDPHDLALLPRVNHELVAALDKWRARRKGTIVIWTMGGWMHADMARRFVGWGHLRPPEVVCMGKPDLIIDDAGHDKLFSRHRAIFPHEFKCPEA